MKINKQANQINNKHNKQNNLDLVVLIDQIQWNHLNNLQENNLNKQEMRI
jgi:hypothetical protein